MNNVGDTIRLSLDVNLRPGLMCDHFSLTGDIHHRMPSAAGDSLPGSPNRTEFVRMRTLFSHKMTFANAVDRHLTERRRGQL